MATFPAFCATCLAGVALVGLAGIPRVAAQQAPHDPYIAPAPPEPQPNGLYDLIAAADLIAARSDDPEVTAAAAAANPRGASGSDLTPAETQAIWVAKTRALRRLMPRNGPAIAKIAEGLSKQCAAPGRRKAGADFSGLAKLRTVARLNGDRMDVARLEGDHAAAVRIGLDTFEIANGLSRHGVLVDYLVASSVRDLVRNRLVDSAERLTAAQADAAGNRMDYLLASMPSLPVVMEEERNTILLTLDTEFASGEKPDTGDSNDVDLGMPTSPQDWANQRKQVLPEIDRYIRALADTLAQPVVRRKTPPAPAVKLVQTIAEPLVRTVSMADTANTRNRELRCLLAITAYRRRAGRLPADLKVLDLAPDWITDPFSGKPFIYRPVGQQFTLYSVGPNLLDDGGRPDGGGGDDVGLWPYRPGQTPGLPGGERMVPHMTTQEKNEK